ncbi:MAG: hypothetical protein ACKV2Q_22350 [Planctomycetaceae bacterium]
MAPISDELVTRLKSVVLKAHPEAKCDLKDGELICEFRTQTFMLHAVDRGGAVAKTAHEEVGPKDGGFIIKVAVWKAPYEGAAGKPYGVHRRIYWHDYINEYKMLGSERVVRLDLSYGIEPNTTLFREIRALCSAYGTPLFQVKRERSDFKNISWREVDSADEEWRYFNDAPETKRRRR